MGFLIVVDGIDGTGKETQTKLLEKKLKEEYNINKVKRISFPNYDSKYCEMLKSYLNGDFGLEPNEYAIITMYALDRWTSFITEWKEYYDQGYIIICDRYVQSMMIYTATRSCKKELIDFIKDLEFCKYQIPKADLVFYLDMEKPLIKGRKNKITNEEKLDIIESNTEFLSKLRNTALTLSKQEEWIVVDCIKEDKLKSIEDINEVILNKCLYLLKGK